MKCKNCKEYIYEKYPENRHPYSQWFHYTETHLCFDNNKKPMFMYATPVIINATEAEMA